GPCGYARDRGIPCFLKAWSPLFEGVVAEHRHGLRGPSKGTRDSSPSTHPSLSTKDSLLRITQRLPARFPGEPTESESLKRRTGRAKHRAHPSKDRPHH